MSRYIKLYQFSFKTKFNLPQLNVGLPRLYSNTALFNNPSVTNESLINKEVVEEPTFLSRVELENSGIIGNDHLEITDTIDGFIKLNEGDHLDSSVLLDLNYQPGIALVTLNNPKFHNSITPNMVKNLYQHLITIKKEIKKEDSKLLGLIVTGKGSSFCSGLNFNFIKKALNVPIKSKLFSKVLQSILEDYSKLPIISICAIEGFALGAGAEMTTFTDYRICSKSAKVRFLQRNLATVPFLGGSKRLLQMLGYQNALYYLGTSSPLPIPNDNNSNEFFIQSAEPGTSVDKSIIFLNKFIYINKNDNVDIITLRKMKSLMKSLSNNLSNENALQLENELFGTLWAHQPNLDAVEKASKK